MPVPEQTPVFLVILDAQGTPVFIQAIDVPDDALVDDCPAGNGTGQ